VNGHADRLLAAAAQLLARRVSLSARYELSVEQQAASAAAGPDAQFLAASSSSAHVTLSA